MKIGISSAGIPDKIAETNSFITKGARLGCQRFLWLIQNTRTSWVRPIRIPGTAPAINSAPTEAPEIMEYTIMGVEGGIIMPMVEEATVITADAEGG